MSDSAKQFFNTFHPSTLFALTTCSILEMSSGILLRKLQLITAKCFAIKCQQLLRHAVLNSGFGMNIFNSEISIAHLNISI